MYLVNVENNQRCQVTVELVVDKDYTSITKSRYFFNWKKEKGTNVYKLVYQNEILGLVAFEHCSDQRIEIRLLSVSKENRGKNKKYERIAGTLIGFACREAIKLYGIDGCVSLVPKTSLKQHYIEMYGMQDAGYRVFLEGIPLLTLLREYEL